MELSVLHELLWFEVHTRFDRELEALWRSFFLGLVCRVWLSASNATQRASQPLAVKVKHAIP